MAGGRSSVASYADDPGFRHRKAHPFRTCRCRFAGPSKRNDEPGRLPGGHTLGGHAEPDELERTGRAGDCRHRRRTRLRAWSSKGGRMTRKVLPKAITRTRDELQEINTGTIAERKRPAGRSVSNPLPDEEAPEPQSASSRDAAEAGAAPSISSPPLA